MTRQQHLQFCKVCTNRKKDLNRGIVCGLTDRIADFEGECASFQEDEILKQREIEREAAYTVKGKVAGQGKRFANYFIDQLFVVGLGAIFGALLGIVLAYFAPQHLSIFDDENKLLEYALGIIITLMYYSFFEGFTGRSLGKFFTKTKVVTEEGERPDFGTIFVRSLCRNIPFNAFSFLGADAVGWHDKFSKTRVIDID